MAGIGAMGLAAAITDAHWGVGDAGIPAAGLLVFALCMPLKKSGSNEAEAKK